MYLCYVDESGNLDCQINDRCKDDEVKPPLFVLSALCVWDHHWPKFSGFIDQRKEALKQKIFRTRGVQLGLSDCELKSSWIRIRKLRRKNPFLSNLSDEDLTGLVNLCYQQIEYAKMTLFAVIIDKRKLLEHFDSDKLHRKAWELLLERVENFMRERHDRHKVIFMVLRGLPYFNAHFSNFAKKKIIFRRPKGRSSILDISFGMEKPVI